jgi:hypothetical protein
MWTSRADKPEDIHKFLNYAPVSMQKLIKRYIQMDYDAKLSLGVNNTNSMELPAFSAGSKLTCPGSTTVKDVIMFL